MDPCGNSQHPHRLAQKRRLLALRFGQGHGDLRAAKRNGNSREARTGPKVQQRGNSGRQGAGARDRLDKMAGENALFAPDRGQVDAGVPAKNKRKIVFEPPGLDCVHWLQTSSRKESVEPLACCMSSFVHAPATDSSIRRGCHTTAACTNAAKMARENALWRSEEHT